LVDNEITGHNRQRPSLIEHRSVELVPSAAAASLGLVSLCLERAIPLPPRDREARELGQRFSHEIRRQFGRLACVPIDEINSRRIYSDPQQLDRLINLVESHPSSVQRPGANPRAEGPSGSTPG
jgi:hypothetical protein